MTGAPSLRTAARSSPVSRRAVVPYTVTGQRPSSPASAPPLEHRVRVEEQQHRAVRPLEHRRLAVKELSHIPHQAQQRPRACRSPGPQSGEPVLPCGAVGIQHGLSSPAHASLSAPASSSGWRIIR